jgi:hypothetical protein
LRRQHRPDQRPGPGDRREMMAEEHGSVGGHEIQPVGLGNRGVGLRGSSRSTLSAMNRA